MAHNEWCLRPNETLREGEYLRSKNGCFHAVMQSDSNFVIYRGDWAKYSGPFNTSLWNVVQHARDACVKNGPKAGPYSITMQSDGNLVIYGEGGKPFWSMGGFAGVNWGRNRNGWAILQDDGVLFVGPADHTWDNRIWSTVDLTPASVETVENFEFERIEYDLKPEHAKITDSLTKFSTTEFCVNSSSIQQDQSMDLTWVDEWSESFGTTTTLEIGVTASVTAGVPKVAEGKVEVSAKVTQGFEWNKTTGGRVEKKLTKPVKVPPHKTVAGRCQWTVSTVRVPYRGIGTAKFKNWSYGRIPVHFEGVYEGKNVDTVRTSWTEIEEENQGLRFWRGEENVET
jgi:hypothetical protein